MSSETIGDLPSTCVDAEPFALQVTDDSMEPEFARGCVIIVDPTGHLRDGAFVLAEVDGGYLFRVFRQCEDGCRLEPLNPACADPAMDVNPAMVRGVIVQRAGTRRSYFKRYD